MTGELEKRVDRRRLSPEKIQAILDSHLVYNGNAKRASKELGYTSPSVLKYWKSNGLQIKGIKGKNGPKNKSQHHLIQELISLRYSQSEISRELGISRQAVNDYLKYHDLECVVGGEKNEYKKYNLIKRLIKEGDLFEEIAEFSGIKYFWDYLRRHPTLSIPKKRKKLERERKTELIKKGLSEGLSQRAIAKKEGIPPGTVNYYIKIYSIKTKSM